MFYSRRYTLVALLLAILVIGAAMLFGTPQYAARIARRLIGPGLGVQTVRVTFPEGYTTRDMGLKIAQSLPSVSAKAFTASSSSYEGYLFPDTYLFPVSADTASVI